MSRPINDGAEEFLPEDGESKCDLCGSESEEWNEHDKQCPIYIEGAVMEEGDRRYDEARDNALSL